jgi:cell division protein FtsQ
VQRQQGRRRLWIMVAVAAVAVVVCGLVGSFWSPLWNVRHVRITAPGVPPAEVLSVSGLSRPRPMIDIDTAAIAGRLDAVPSLGGARVIRSWPATVRVSVKPRQAVAAVPLSPSAGSPGGQPGWASVDATGRVLADVSAVAAGLPIIQGAGTPPPPGGWLAASPGPAAAVAGPGGVPAPVAVDAAADDPAAPSGIGAALAVAALLPSGIRDDVASITVGSGGAVTMAVLPATIAVGSISVSLGDGSQLAPKVTALATLLSEANLTGVGSIDLSVPGRPAALTARQTPGTVSTHAGG